MIRIYAVDPDLATDPFALMPIVREVGVSHGRILAEFPRSWRKQLIVKADSLGETRDGLRARELVKDISLCSWKRMKMGLPYDGDSTWLDNAVKNVSSFDAVIHCDDVQDLPDVARLHPALEVASNGNFWVTPRETKIIGGPKGLASLLAPFLQLNPSLAIMDPWYSPRSADYGRAMTAIFGAVPTLKDVVIHASAESSEGSRALSTDEWKTACEEALGKHCIEGRRIAVVRWKEGDDGRRPHRRWIASPYGAISLDRGLQTRAGNSAALIDQIVGANIWSTYSPLSRNEASEFEFHDRCLVAE